MNVSIKKISNNKVTYLPSLKISKKKKKKESYLPTLFYIFMQ